MMVLWLNGEYMVMIVSIVSSGDNDGYSNYGDNYSLIFASWYIRDPWLTLISHQRLDMSHNCGMQTESPKKKRGGNAWEHPLSNWVFLFTFG